MTREFLSGQDICSQFSISRTTLYRLVKTGELQKPIKFGRASRWPKSVVDDLFDRKCEEGAA